MSQFRAAFLVEKWFIRTATMVELLHFPKISLFWCAWGGGGVWMCGVSVGVWSGLAKPPLQRVDGAPKDWAGELYSGTTRNKSCPPAKINRWQSLVTLVTDWTWCFRSDTNAVERRKIDWELPSYSKKQKKRTTADRSIKELEFLRSPPN